MSLLAGRGRCWREEHNGTGPEEEPTLTVLLPLPRTFPGTLLSYRVQSAVWWAAAEHNWRVEGGDTCKFRLTATSTPSQTLPRL